MCGDCVSVWLRIGRSLFLQKAPFSEIFFLLWQKCLFYHTMKTQTAVTFWQDVDTSHCSHMPQHILNGKFHDWWDEEVKPVIYITCNEIKYYFNLCGATNVAHIKPHLGFQKIWGFLQILKQVITFFSFIYSGTSIYRSRNDRFPASTVRHFWSRMKFHINNVIYSRIHRSPNYRFTALIVCKSRSRRSISRMDRLKKKIEAKYLLSVLPSLWTINLATQ